MMQRMLRWTEFAEKITTRGVYQIWHCNVESRVTKSLEAPKKGIDLIRYRQTQFPNGLPPHIIQYVEVAELYISMMPESALLHNAFALTVYWYATLWRVDGCRYGRVAGRLSRRLKRGGDRWRSCWTVCVFTSWPVHTPTEALETELGRNGVDTPGLVPTLFKPPDSHYSCS